MLMFSVPLSLRTMQGAPTIMCIKGLMYIATGKYLIHNQVHV